jgi:hypothetical protein
MSQTEEELAPVAIQISNAQVKISIDGEIIPSFEKKEYIPCEFIFVIIIAFIFLFVGIFVFLGRFIFKN